MTEFTQPKPTISEMVFAPTWEKQPLDLSGHCDLSHRLFVVPPNQSGLEDSLRTTLPEQAKIVTLDDAGIDIALAFIAQPNSTLTLVSRMNWASGIDDQAIDKVFSLIKRLIGFPEITIELVVFKAIRNPAVESVTFPADGVFVGLFQTLLKEHPTWNVRTLVLNQASPVKLSQILGANLPIKHPQPIGISEDSAYFSKMEPASLSMPLKADQVSTTQKTAFKQGGSYLIIGGNGGLGSLLGKYLASHYQANLIVVSRRGAEDFCSELEALGAKQAKSYALDLCDEQAVNRVFAEIAHLDGVIHSALVLQDAAIANMNAETLFSVLRPKVHGARNLLNAIKHRRLDFCLFFSSIQSYIANAGQANYSAACVAKDAFAEVLHQTFMHNTKVINWAFWGNVGIVAKPEYREIMQRREIGSIEAEEGLAIIEQFLTSSLRQITVIKASDKALRSLDIEPHSHAEQQSSTATNDDESAQALAKQIIPEYSLQNPQVRYNESMSAHLQAYSRWLISTIPLPSTHVPAFNKLVSAIKAMKPDTSPIRAQLIQQFPELAGHIKLVDTCLAPLPQILTGDVDPLSIMFPEGSFHLVEPVYRDNPIADYFNQKAAEIVQAFQRRVQRPIRILEIGAGTGSTTQFVLPKLDTTTALYTFTDLSFAFLNKARKRFADYPFMEYKICNIENPPEFEHPYDVVVATNVIHATADLPKVLANVRNVMSDDGIFVLNEITSLQDYATLTFGLTEGWWLSIDPYRIPNSPLLTGDTWQRLLREVGFSFTDAHGSDDQQVIVGFTRASVESTQSSSVSAISEKQEPSTLDELWVQAYISRAIAEIMHFDEAIDPNIPFSEIGIDSLIALELLKPLKDDLGYIPTTVLFEYPTLKQLAAHFFEEHFEALQSLFASEQTQPNIPQSEETTTKAENSSPTLSAQLTSGSTVAPVNNAAVPAEEIATQVASMIAEVMMMDANEIHPKVPFNEYGIDSLIALELLKPLREHYGYLPATLLFEYPTLAALADYLATLTPAVAATEHQAGEDAAVEQESIAQEESQAPPLSTAPSSEIAIVGLSARMPQVDSVQAFWEQLVAGHSLTAELPSERWSADDFATSYPLTQRGSYSQRAAFIHDIDAFDHQFFRLTPAEAERMDPQERLFLQQCYQTMLDAGMPQQHLQGSDTGVFVGVMNGGYQWYEPKDSQAQPPTSLFWSMANRASYLFGWHGPSMAIDTACSSSLTALHLACQALRLGECEQAVVGGVNIIAHPKHFELLCGLHMLSPTETCKPFGINADGFVDGEGVIVLMLQPLQKAKAEGRRIHGVIKGSAINAGGQSNGYTAPNPEAQRHVIEKALNAASVKPEQVSYIEAHGTGTELGDPIELRALSKAYEHRGEHKIALGSVKSNIGHLESAAGLSGLLKVVLQMQHQTLVPSINAQTVNPHLAMDASPFQLVQHRQPWLADKKIAGISSFGAGGANAHVLIASEAKSDVKPMPATVTPVIIALSHHTASGLQQRLDDLSQWLETSDNEVMLLPLAYRLSVLEDQHAQRVTLQVSSISALRQRLLEDLPTLRSNLVPDNQFSQSFINGAVVDWQEMWANHYSKADVALIKQAAMQLSLPSYPFTPSRHWIDAEISHFKGISSLVAAHRINGSCIAPAAWSVAEALERAIAQLPPQHAAIGAVAIEQVVWQAKIEQPEQIDIRQHGQQLVFEHQGKSVCQVANIQSSTSAVTTIDSTKQPGSHRVTGAEIYQQFAAEGYQYGRYLQGIRRVDIGEQQVNAFLVAQHDWGYAVSPALIDSMLQLAMLMPRKQPTQATLLPYSMGRCELIKLPETHALYARCSERTERSQGAIRCFDFELYDEEHQLVLRIEELVSVVVDDATSNTTTPKNSALTESSSASVEVYDL